MTTIQLTPFKNKDTKDSAEEQALVLEQIKSTGAIFLDDKRFPLELTGRAIEMVYGAIQETDAEDGEYLRVGIRGGGCAGFEYSLNFTDDVDEDDVVTLLLLPEGNDDAGTAVVVVTDTFSAAYLKGTELDYVESVQGAGFKFINPNAKRTCGCGSSFSV
ncbi:MAG: iron-sulfur cluster assembly accessory protein [Deltaproteobacteria bacterium]|nr:iron-sulfur cluster assembly accessory protein [Deltaproteobacteria bacterium]